MILEPRYGTELPFIPLKAFFQCGRGVAQFGTLMRCGVPAYSTVVDRLWCEFGIGEFVGDAIEMLFGRGPILFHERNTAETHFEMGPKFFSRQISLESRAFVTVRIHY